MIQPDSWVRLREWYRTYGRHHLPWRSSRSPWSILVAETLLHRTRADIVARVFDRILGDFPDPESVVRKPDLWIQHARVLGLAWRLQSFIETCQILMARHDGKVPIDRRALLELPGIGHYTAGAVRCFGHGLRESLVDANTIRLAVRISAITLDPRKHRSQTVRKTVEQLGDHGNAPDADDNFALLDLAALICRPREMQHIRCPIIGSCATGREAQKLSRPNER